MSSHDLQNLPWSSLSPSERVLMALKTRGPQTAATLGAALEITGEAARQQLARLAKEGFVEATSEPRGVGRPAHLWRLTAAGHSRFPDTHAELTVQLLKTIRHELGQRALDTLISAREQETRANYLREMEGATGLRDRIARLAAMRRREGYMAEWREEPDGSFLLIENHCPICAAAAECQGFCRAELAIFQQVLGEDVVVERLDHILAGARRCAYRITEVAPGV